MDQRVLVTYASKHGATAQIAEKIGQVLCEAGVAADVVSVGRVRDLTRYTAVVLGSAVYIGKWRKEAERFLEANEQALRERQVWLFSSGPTGKGDPTQLTRGWQFPTALQPIADRIGPCGVAVFHGHANLKKLNFIEMQMLSNVKAPFGDFRDWEAITAWAAGIAKELRRVAA